MKDDNVRAILLGKIEELPIPTLALNALRITSGIETIGELVQCTAKDLMRVKYIGRNSVAAIENILREKGLSLGMNIEKYKDNSNRFDIIPHLVEGGYDLSVTIKLSDLLQFANHLIHSAKEELESAVLAKNKEVYVTPDEAKVQLHVDRSTLWRWAKTGYLIPVEVGGKRLYKQSDIDAILNV